MKKRMMNNIEILPSTLTPHVDFNSQAGTLKISGISGMEDPIAFYGKLVDWLKDYAKSPALETTLHLHLDYFNRASSQEIFRLMLELESCNNGKNYACVKWYYEEGDDEILDAGYNFNNQSELDFYFIDL